MSKKIILNALLKSLPIISLPLGIYYMAFKEPYADIYSMYGIVLLGVTLSGFAIGNTEKKLTESVKLLKILGIIDKVCASLVVALPIIGIFIYLLHILLGKTL